ncbi:helix-turn-helix transcriptional regulator [Microbacterium sp. E-13]|uniref:helix-turn-helix transcriptional regulator n=1 Tax=Microbacterium sp. E-13 TaxID=3404048 RepID=UPI003CEFB7F6
MASIIDLRSEDPEHTFLTPQELADMLQTIPLSRLGAWRRNGEGPKYLKWGRTVVYKLSDIDAWLQESTHHSTSDRLPGSRRSR